jgi:hypothetical protein
MDNIARVTGHLRKKILAAGGDPDRETLNLVPTKDGEAFLHTDDGDYWRTYIFVEGARTYDIVENINHVYNAANTFGRFQSMVSDLPDPRLYETIPHFGDSAKRFRDFTEAIGADTVNRAASAKPEIEFALPRGNTTSVVMDLLAEGKIPERIAHYDTKFNNVMIDNNTGEGICVIDLDTVMPGTVLYDFGDSVRLGINPAAEDETDLSKVRADMDMFERLTHGYLDAARGFLTPVEIGHLVFAARLITFTIGIRFLADYLAGDVYFKTHRPDHNLIRCRTQFAMVKDMEDKQERMDAIVEKYAKG